MEPPRAAAISIPVPPSGVEDDLAWQDLLDWWPLRDDCLRPLRSTAFFSDFVSEREKSKHRWYAEVMRPTSQEHECKVLLPAPGGVPAISTIAIAKS